MRGFTLVELLVVLAIAAGTLALVLPGLSKASAIAGLNSSTRELAAVLRAARGEAIARHAEVACVIDLAQNAYRSTGSPGLHRVAPGVRLTLVAAHTELSGAQAGAIRFFADGSSSGGRIALAAAGRERLIDIDWLTGRVAIHE